MDITRPGGELVEMMVTPQNITFDPNTGEHLNALARPFFFVSDSYTVNQVSNALAESCLISNISDPIPFNLTGNMQPGNLLQYYRGDSAAILLEGYDNSKEPSDSPNLVPNPPFPLNVSVDAWSCLNQTIGASVPLMNTASGFPQWAIALIVVLSCVFLGLISLGVWLYRKRRARGGPKDRLTPVPDRRCGSYHRLNQSGDQPKH